MRKAVGIPNRYRVCATRLRLSLHSLAIETRPVDGAVGCALVDCGIVQTIKKNKNTAISTTNWSLPYVGLHCQSVCCCEIYEYC